MIFNISKIILLSNVSDSLPTGYWNKAPMNVFTKTSIEIWKILKPNLAPQTWINQNDAPYIITIPKERIKDMGEFLYRSFKDMNLGVENSGADFLVSKIGTKAKEINKDVRIYKCASVVSFRFISKPPPLVEKYNITM